VALFHDPDLPPEGASAEKHRNRDDEASRGNVIGGVIVSREGHADAGNTAAEKNEWRERLQQGRYRAERRGWRWYLRVDNDVVRAEAARSDDSLFFF